MARKRMRKQVDPVAPSKEKKPHRPLTVEALTPVLRRLRGNFTACAKSFRVTRQAVSKFVKEHGDELGDVVAECRETRLDYAESSLDNAVEEGEAWAVCFTLKTQGKSRGYVERQEVTGADGAPLIPAVVIGEGAEGVLPPDPPAE